MKFDMESFLKLARAAFRVVLWISLVFAMYNGEWMQVAANAVILAVLELEEINEKMD